MKRITTTGLAGLFSLVIVYGSLAAPYARTQDDKSDKLTDKTVQTVVEHRLKKHGLLVNDNLQVSVKDSVITLTGTVPSLAARKQAQHDAQEAEESYRVVNDLTVQPSNLSDAKLAQAVMNQIQTHIFYSIFDWVTAVAHSDSVTLQGWVAEPWEKSEFVAQAKKVPGVASVYDNIQTLPNSIFDDQLRRAAAREIYDDPMFAYYANEANPPIHIIVDNGHVTLEGTVGSGAERSWAGDLVSMHTEAISVDNQLQVRNQ